MVLDLGPHALERRSAQRVLGPKRTQKMSKLMTAQGSGEVCVDEEVTWPPLAVTPEFFLRPRAGNTLSLTRRCFFCVTITIVSLSVFHFKIHFPRSQQQTHTICFFRYHRHLSSTLSNVNNLSSSCTHVYLFFIVFKSISTDDTLFHYYSSTHPHSPLLTLSLLHFPIPPHCSLTKTLYPLPPASSNHCRFLVLFFLVSFLHVSCPSSM